MAGINKVVLKNSDGVEEVKLDLTADTVDATQVVNGVTFHDKAGDSQTGTMPLIDFADAGTWPSMPEYAPHQLATKGDYFYINDQFSTTPTAYKGSYRVQISDDEQAKLVPENIKQDITVLGVTGTLSTPDRITTFSYTDKEDQTHEVQWLINEGDPNSEQLAATIPAGVKSISFTPGELTWLFMMMNWASINIEQDETPTYTLDNNDAGGQTLTIKA